MRIKLLWVGKTKERPIAEGVEKYIKLLGRYARVEVSEVKEHRTGSAHSRVKREGQRILAQAKKGFVLLDERGRGLTSIEFASWLKGKSGAEFVIGGPYGVADEVRQGAGDMLSLSPMTLTHEMSRLLLVEQIYRAMNIIKGGGYHH